MSYQGPDTYYDGRDRPDESLAIRVRNGVDLGGFFGILARQFRWILIGLAITFGLAFYYIFFGGLAYTSTISILIDARERQPIGSDQQPLPQQADPVMVESQLKLMTSSAVLRRVAVAENLESDPEFAPSDHVGLIGGLFNLVSRGKVQVPAMDQIVDALTQRITLKRPERTYVVDMDVKASSPGKAARLANAIAKAFIEEERSVADAFAQDQSEWVIKRTQELRGKVETAEKKVQDYKAQNGIVDVQGTLTQEQQLQDANRDLAAARAKSGEAQARYDQIKKIIASGKTLDGTYDAMNSAVVRQLRIQYADLIRREAALSQKYGTRHPEYIDIAQQVTAVRKQIDDEMQRIATALQNEALVARDNAEAAQRRVQILEQKTTATNEVSLQLKELQRVADGERTNYEKFLRANDSIRRDAIETPYARIVAPASYPGAPSSPKTMAALLIAASGGLSLGIGLAVFMDRGPATTIYYPGTTPNAPLPTAPETPPASPMPPGRRPSDRRPPDPAAPHDGTTAPPPGSNPFAFAAAPPDPATRTETRPARRAEAEPSGLFGWKARLRERRPLVPHDAARSGPLAGSLPVAVAAEAEAEALPLEMASPAVDPRDVLMGLAGDLAAGNDRRIVITGRARDMQKTDLALLIARGLAARGHAVLVIDGDDDVAALSHLALRDGIPARVPFEGLEAQVLGLPSLGEGVIFVLPQRSVTGDMSHVAAPLIDTRIRAVIIEAPREGVELARFRALGDIAYLVDAQGYLRLIDVDQSIGHAMQAAGLSTMPSHLRRA